MSESAMQRRAAAALVHLQSIMIDPPYQHWLQGGDQGMSYCSACAQKAVDAGDAEAVDGGWDQECDGQAFCETCGIPLQYTLTDYGVEQELESMMAAKDLAALSPAGAYAISRVLERYDQDSEVLRLVPKIERALGWWQQLTDHQFDVLVELQGCEQVKLGGRTWTLPDGSKARLFMPMEFGGSSGSHHSATATALAKRGLVDRLKVVSWGGGSQLNVFKGSAKGSCHYRITDAGKEVLARAAGMNADA